MSSSPSQFFDSVDFDDPVIHVPVHAPNLREAQEECWQLLSEGQRLRQSPFHQGVLATSPARGPSARYVVLRRVDADRGVLGFHTDARSTKLKELAQDNRVAWCFFGGSIQIRIEGRARVHTDDAIADDAWRRTGLMSRRCYLVEQKPGAVVDHAVSGLPEGMVNRRPSTEESELGRPNFAIVTVTAHTIEWLNLAASGHLRARFTRQASGWSSQWLAP